MSDITISYLNTVHLKVNCKSQSTAMELVDFFAFDVPGARFMPAFRHKVWDGKIRLFNAFNQQLYIGLLPYLAEFAKERNYKISLDSSVPKDLFNTPETLSTEASKSFIRSLEPFAHGKAIEPLPHQVEGLKYTVNNSRCLLLSPTASGKSLILYSLCRYYLPNLKRKILVIVPTVSLVEQLYSDFEDYSTQNKWSTEDNVHKIYEGQDKKTSKKIVISTYQSLHRLPKEYFEQFECVFVDEAHSCKSASITSILSKLTECPVRVGMTGTLDGMKTHKLIIEGLTGKVQRLAYTKDLMDADILSPLKINCITLKYSEEIRKANKELKYQEELEYLIFNPQRNNFIADLAIHTKGNTLVLFRYVEKHGKVLHELILNKLKNTDRKVFFVSGKTEVEVREEVRRLTEFEKDAILVCSDGTFSQGISIRNLHNIVFASPSKGRIRVLQSIGRQLRKSENKTTARLYDISDDMSWKSRQNYSLKHLIERLKIYNEERFDYKLAAITLK